MTNKFYALAFVCCCVSALLVGCNKGPKMVHITGTVSVAGEPIDSGSITFNPADGQGQSDGAVITDGKFEADVAVGAKSVKCYGTKVLDEEVEVDPVLQPGVMAKKRKDYPAKVFTEEILVTIEKKDQVVEINYTGEGAPKK